MALHCQTLGFKGNRKTLVSRSSICFGTELCQCADAIPLSREAQVGRSLTKEKTPWLGEQNWLEMLQRWVML